MGSAPSQTSSTAGLSSANIMASAGDRKLVSESGHSIRPLTSEEISEAKKGLTSEERRILLDHGTERAFSGPLYNEKREGVYVCALGGLPLFSSKAKFESGSGWPSFYEPIDSEHVIEKTDASFGMVRTEVLDARTSAHLGHVFDDGPRPTGKRYCINSAALRFIPDGAAVPAESQRDPAVVEAEAAAVAESTGKEAAGAGAGAGGSS